MKWSFKLGRIAGIDLHLHATFGLLLLWVAGTQLAHSGSWHDAALSVALVLCIFAAIVLHELSHALVARRFGVGTRDITLYPIGGVARLERMPERPLHELLVAVVGPLVNFVIAGALFGALAAMGQIRPPSLESPSAAFVANLASANLVIAVFNLLPAFPMDGGRALRALIAMRADRVTATRVAAGLGRGLAVVFAVLGFFANPILLLIAAFVWLAGGQELAATELKASLQGVSVGDAMLRRFAVFSPRDSIGRIAEAALRGTQADFPIVEGGRLVGMLPRLRLLEALASRGADTAAGTLMETDVAAAVVTEPLADAVSRLAELRGGALPVLRDGGLVGLLSMDRVDEVVALRRAMDGSTPRELRPPRKPFGGQGLVQAS